MPETHNGPSSGGLVERYTAQPYPPYDPASENELLDVRPLDQLDTLSDRCFKGGLDIRDGIRVLVAGGGTGADTRFLAEQLRDTPSEVVYVDSSPASMQLAQEGARMRGLSNIEWISGSLLDLPGTQEPFDYINCCGVLHHLQDPQAGLQALESMLHPDGAMGLLVYAKYGHSERYRLRDMLTYTDVRKSSVEERIATARLLVASMPQEWREDPANRYLVAEAESDQGIYDALLHTQERDYTVNELYDWLEAAGLKKIAFASPYTSGEASYQPESYLSEEFWEQVSSLPRRNREAVAELASGHIVNQVLYAGHNTDRTASIEDSNIVPAYSMAFDEVARNALIQVAASRRFEAVSIGPLAHPNRELRVFFGQYGAALLRQVDGQRSVPQIIATVGEQTGESSDNLFAAFGRIANPLRQAEWLALRQDPLPPYPNAHNIQQAQADRSRSDGQPRVKSFALDSLDRTAQSVGVRT